MIVQIREIYIEKKMLDVQEHMMQPLYVDTSSCYDLDLSKFPGLNDPDQMWEPALILASPWNGHLDVDDETAVRYDNSADIPTDDLLSIQVLPDLACMDQQTLDYLIEDITDNQVMEADPVNSFDVSLGSEVRSSPLVSPTTSDFSDSSFSDMVELSPFSGDLELSPFPETERRCDAFSDKLPPFDVWVHPTSSYILNGRCEQYLFTDYSGAAEISLTSFDVPIGYVKDHHSLVDRGC